MSNNTNEALIERASSAIDLAHDHIEYWAGTLHADLLDSAVAQCMKNIDDNNFDDLYTVNLPYLETALQNSLHAMEQADAVRDNFEAEYDPEAAQETADILRDQLREDGVSL